MLYAAAKLRAAAIADQSVGPFSGLIALAAAEHSSIMSWSRNPRRKPVPKELRALVEICAIYSLGVGGKRIGDRILIVPSRFSAPARVKTRVRLKLKKPKKRLKLKKRSG